MSESKNKITQRTLKDLIREIFSRYLTSDGELNKTGLLAEIKKLTGQTEGAIGRAFHAHRQIIFENEGKILIPVRGKNGMLRKANPTETVVRVKEGGAKKVIKMAERHLAGLGHAQRNDELSEEARSDLNREEAIRSRDVMNVKRMYADGARKRPAGL